jgi:hypothetical protein
VYVCECMCVCVSFEPNNIIVCSLKCVVYIESVCLWYLNIFYHSMCVCVREREYVCECMYACVSLSPIILVSCLYVV